MTPKNIVSHDRSPFEIITGKLKPLTWTVGGKTIDKIIKISNFNRQLGPTSIKSKSSSFLKFHTQHYLLYYLSIHTNPYRGQ